MAHLALNCWIPVAQAHDEDLKALYKCALIVVAQYTGCENRHSVSLHNPPIADFATLKVLKGPPLSMPHFLVRFESDILPPKIPPHWKFDEAVMPEKDSKWLLFIEHPESHDKIAHLTYQGPVGRMKYTDAIKMQVVTNIASEDR